jgi:Tfp pilus assembly protein PilF
VFLEIPGQRPAAAKLSATVTGTFPQATIELFAGEEKAWSTKTDLTVGTAFRDSVPLDANTRGKVLNLRIHSSDGRSLLEHKIYPDASHPNAVYAGDSVPRKYGSLETLQVEELYQKGLGNEKFGQVADAEEAYRVALSKDPLFSPVQLRLGLMAMERFDYTAAIPHLEKVLERDPTNGDAHYLLGIIFSEMNRRLDAERHYYRLLPSAEKFERRDYMLALLDLKTEQWPEAAAKLARAAAASPLDLSVREAFAYLLRKSVRPTEAQAEQQAILKLDATNAFARSEQYFDERQRAGTGSSASANAATLSRSGTGKGERAALQALDQACARHPQGYLELATEYLRLSALDEAGSVLDRGIEVARESGGVPYPLLLYYRAYVAGQRRETEVLARSLAEARSQDMKLDLFPFRFEDVKVLEHAIKSDKRNANAAVLLGDLLYSRGRGSDAIASWRTALQYDPNHFFALRDLGMALLVGNQRSEGLELLTRASVARPEHLATTMLLADINARLGNTEAVRQTFQRALDKEPGRDALVEKLASVETQLGNQARALNLLTTHTFEATHQSYSLLHLYRGVRLMLALDAYEQKNMREALDHTRLAAQPPTSLGIDSFATVASSRLLMFEALLFQAAGDTKRAQAAWQAASETRDDEYEGEGLFRAIALQKIGQTEKASAWLSAFPAVNDQRKTDSAINLRVQAHCLAGIYAAFEGDDAKARESLRRSLELDQSYLYARQALAWLEAGLLKGLRQ